MTLELTNARYAWIDGYPVLKLDVNGRTATRDTEWKPSLRARGIVFLGSEFADLVPPIEFRSDEGGVTTLDGFTQDPRVFRLFERFWNEREFTPGPVPIPE